MTNTGVILPTAATLVLLMHFFPRHSAVAAPAVSSTPGGSTEQTYYYRNDDKEQLTHVSHIIDALEALGVLASRQTCYTLEKITKTPVTKGTSHPWKIGIFLYMSEAESATPLDGDTNPSKPDNERIAEVALPDYNCCENALNNSTEDIGAKSNRSRKHDPDTAADSQSTWVEDVHFSKTQILVIVTCSTVIGAFFITAFAMRLRNYLKRIHSEEQTAGQCRSMSMFGGSHYYTDTILKA